jgi:TonB family protein
MLFEQSKQQLPAYCKENSYICFRKAKASFYRNNEKGNLATALLLHKSGCDGGSPEACSALAIMYKNGLGTKQNTTKALELFTFACDKKYARACELLGNIYRNGKIVAADLPTAVKYYRLDCHYKKGGECKQLKRLGVQYSSEARPISRFPPLYPIQAVMRGKEGSCKMTFDVSDKGKVQNVRTTCTDTIFSKAAKKSIYQWKYEPKIVDGVAVTSTDISTMLYFKLN